MSVFPWNLGGSWAFPARHRRNNPNTSSWFSSSCKSVSELGGTGHPRDMFVAIVCIYAYGCMHTQLQFVAIKYIYKFLIDIFMNSHAMSYLHFHQTSRDGLYLRWLTWSMGFPKARPQRGEIWQMGQTVTLATLRESQKKWSWAHFYIYIIHA